MDTTEQFTAIEWCAGYGGIHLGLKRAIRNLRVVAYGEIEAFACANLVSKMEAGLLDAAPIWTDIKTFPCTEFRDRVDLLVAGYPCQPFSAAGKRLGTEDPRHLWPHIARAIRVIRPRLCFFENVEGHISLGLREVVGELEQIGYKSSFGLFSAAEIGAPHQRKRVFILAHAAGFGGREDYWTGDTGLSHQTYAIWPSRPGEPQHPWEPPRVVGNASECHGVDAPGIRGALERQKGRREHCDTGMEGAEAMGNAEGSRPQARTSNRIRNAEPDAQSASAYADRGQAQPPLGGDPHGPANRLDNAELFTTCDNRTDELRLLGNGVVPATAERAFRVLIEELMGGQNHGR